MAVKDFMTKKVIYVSPTTKVAKAADIMKEQGIHRLPVIENDKLVGLVTAGTIEKASPSVATSLSVYEMNYLLNKTTVGEVMIREVLTISKYASLEDAVYRMRQNNVGVLPVVDHDQISGVITDKDVFGAFLKIAGYGESGVRVRLLMPDVMGSLAKVADLLADKALDVRSIVQINNDNKKTVVEIQLTGTLSPEEIEQSLVTDRLNSINTNQRALTRHINSIVKECCGSLDNLMNTIRETISNPNVTLTNEQLDYFILNLPALMYYAYEKQELVGMREDIAKQEKLQRYNDSYSSYEGTAIERKQLAESDIVYDVLVISIYSRARKQIQNKLDLATEMLQSLKKVATRRISENDFNNLNNMGYKENL